MIDSQPPKNQTFRGESGSMMGERRLRSPLASTRSLTSRISTGCVIARKREVPLSRKAVLHLLQLLAVLASVHADDRQTLIDFKTSQNSCAAPNTQLQSWDWTQNPDSWYGTTWSSTSASTNNWTLRKLEMVGTVCGTVPEAFSTLIDLEAFVWTPESDADGFVGTAPASWSTLTKLTVLSLSKHRLTSTLPASWSMFTNLRVLRINGNALTGSLPLSWSKLAKLTELKLQDNRLSGSLPSQWSSLANLNARNLTIDLNNNQLTGSLQSSWSNVHALNAIDMSQNHLVGTLPETWSELINLQSVKLGNNSLSGQLPTSWSVLFRLSSLVLQRNQFSGSLPQSWSTLANLYALDLGCNPMSGTLPEWLSQLKKLTTLAVPGSAGRATVPPSLPEWLNQWNASLTVLSLPGYGFAGPLPATLTSFPRLEALNLSFNSFSGTLPAFVSQLNVTAPSGGPVTPPGTQGGSTVLLPLTLVDLSHNRLHGPLPQGWAMLTLLVALNLAGNQLSSSLPESWSTLSSLEKLELSACRLNGTLPASWSSLDSLRVVSLARNDFSGTIPAQWQEGSWWQGAVAVGVNNNRLDGPIPILSDTMQYLSASHNNFSGTLSNIPPSLVYLNVANNSISGSIPTLNSPNILYLNFADNLFTQLPASFQAQNVVFFSLANNSVSGTIPADVINLHALKFCDLAHNELSGPMPASWTSRDWDYLALDGNTLTGSLPDVWSGKVTMLLLENNPGLTGCLPKQWVQNQSINVISLSQTQVQCSLPEAYAAKGAFTQLSFLGLDETSIQGTVPSSWLQGFKNETVLRLGSLWVTSVQKSQGLLQGALSPSNWRRELCLSTNLAVKMGSPLAYEGMREQVHLQLNKALNTTLANLTQVLGSLNLATVVFEIPSMERVIHEGTSPPSLQDICGNRNARDIVAIELAVLCVVLLGMGLLYGMERWLGLITNHRASVAHRHNVTGLHQNKLTPQAAHTVWMPGQYLLPVVFHWFDVIFDILVLSQVWSAGGWPRNTLLTVLVVHYAIAALVLANQIPAAMGLDRSVWWFLLTFLLAPPLTPLLDTAVACTMTLRATLGPSPPLQPSSTGDSLEETPLINTWKLWSVFLMRDVLEAVFEAIPNLILQSTIFVVGSKPEVGVYLSTWLYILSSAGSCLQILKLVGTVFWRAATKTQFSVWHAVRDIFNGNMRRPMFRPSPLSDGGGSSQDTDKVYLRQCLEEL